MSHRIAWGKAMDPTRVDMHLQFEGDEFYRLGPSNGVTEKTAYTV